jgi:hypothetical protein
MQQLDLNGRRVIQQRKDPKPRRVYGVSPEYLKLSGKRPELEYVYVNPGDPISMSKYTSLGYKVETKGKDSPRNSMFENIPDGQPLTVMGQYLMSAPREVVENIRLNGEDGNSGLAMYDEIEQRLITNTNLFDPLRGVTPNGIKAEREEEV